MKTEGNEIVTTVAIPQYGKIAYGLTKREYFAAMIIQGLYANPNQTENAKHFAKDSVDIADELIKALNS